MIESSYILGFDHTVMIIKDKKLSLWLIAITYDRVWAISVCSMSIHILAYGALQLYIYSKDLVNDRNKKMMMKGDL